MSADADALKKQTPARIGCLNGCAAGHRTHSSADACDGLLVCLRGHQHVSAKDREECDAEPDDVCPALEGE